MLVNIRIRYLLFLLLFFCCTSCGPPFYYIHEKSVLDWWDKRKETIATFVDVIHQPETGVSFEYKVNGVKYKGGHNFYVSARRICVGMKYYLAYNPENPKQYGLLLYKPVLSDEEIVSYTKGKIVHVGITSYYSDLKSKIFTISYEIDESKYRCSQHFLLDSTINPKDLKGQYFKVKYWKKDVRRNIILLDEPVSHN